ncbi:MAG TPA: hypothetical protein VET65_13600 [Candidatus Limnocylindrales bacterium]|nr:hypothetical protein [Candidatus Limnocylindrales bacterium]
MSLLPLLYAALLLLAVTGLWAVYRVLGTPSRLAPADYAAVLDDLIDSVANAASRLRKALDAPDADRLEEVATEARKIFQTAYYQTLRLRPLTGPDTGEPARLAMREACEAYDWASRMASADSVRNEAIRAAIVDLIEAGDRGVERARLARPALSPSEPGERTGP